MGLLPAITGSITISTTPSVIDSTGYYYHHITIYLTGTIGISDTYTIEYYKYDPISAAFVFEDVDDIDYTSTASGTKKCWELSPTPGSGFRVIVTKTNGANVNANYEVIRAA